MTAKKPLRRTQAISPFGVGAMVDFPGPTSLVHAGLEAWPVDPANPLFREFLIDDEPRLAHRLGVDRFFLPPDFRENRTGITVENPGLMLPFLRFPLWHSCPACGRMYRSRFHDHSAPYCTGLLTSDGAHKRRKTVQVRFVAACSHGHLQDFPWREWLRLEDADWRPEGNRWLRLRSTGLAGTEGVEIIAEELSGENARVVGRRTLAGAVGGEPGQGDSPLTRLGIRCTGQNPVLALNPDNDHQCGEQLYVLLRGASNLYFSDVISSIFVPQNDAAAIPKELRELVDDSAMRKEILRSALSSESGRIPVKGVRAVLKEMYPELNADAAKLADFFNNNSLIELLARDSKSAAALVQMIKLQPEGKLDAGCLKMLIETVQPEWDIDPEFLLPQVDRWFRRETGGTVEEDSLSDEGSREMNFRRAEYEIFNQDIEAGAPQIDLLVRSEPMEKYGPRIQAFGERISLAHKLRETRAFRGFSRIFSEGLTPEQRWNLISTRPLTWLPAVIVRGEGIFLKLKMSVLADWEMNHGEFHSVRLQRVNRGLEELRKRRQQEGRAISPRYVLLHTLAHLLINELVFECGYGSAALRERIYCSEGEQGMAGILIYTAAGDSEGTMGGLVRMGLPGLLDRAVSRMIERASWCSTDPVCIESHGQGPDNCNLAACHGCSLLPETSCEEQNRLLDRGVLMGTLSRPESGFFRHIERSNPDLKNTF